MPFIDPDTIGKAGASPETAPDAGGMGFVDPDKMQQKTKKDMTLQDMSIPRQMASGAVGGYETIASLGTGFGGLLAGGVAAVGKGAKDLVTKGFIDPDAMAQTMHGVSDAITYQPRSAAGKEFVGGITEGYEGVKDLAGRAMAAQARPGSYVEGTPAWKKAQLGINPVSPEEEAKYRSAGEFTFDAALNVLPMLQMRANYKADLAARLKRNEEQARIEVQQAMEKQQADAANNQRQTELLGEAERVSNPPQYGLPDELRKSQEAELNPPVEERQPGQAEIFTDHAQADIREPKLGESATGFRDTIPGNDLEARGVRGPEGIWHPELTDSEYSGPRQRAEPSPNDVNFQRGIDPNRINDQMAAVEKPGFMRTAEEVMRAREWEKLNNPGARLKDSNFLEFWNDKLSMHLGEGASEKPVRSGLQIIQDTSTTPFYRELAKKILEDKEFNPDFKVEKNLKNNKGLGLAGEYRSAYHQVGIDSRFLGSEQLLLHESVHARVFAAIQAYLAKGVGMGNGWKRMQHLEAPVKRIFDLYKSLQEQVTKNANKPGSRGVNSRGEFTDPQNSVDRLFGKYGMTDVHEFVSEGLTNPAFQAELAQLKVPKELNASSLYKHYWDAFVSSIAKLLGFDKKAGTYLSELLKASSDLMTGMGKEERIHYADQMDGVRDLGAVKSIIQKKGMGETTLEMVREGQLDRRPIEKVVKEELEGRELQDFTPASQNLAKRIYNRLGSLVKENLLQDSTIARLMKNTEGTGALIKWTVDQISRIDRDHMIAVKTDLESALAPFRKMYWNKETRGQLSEMWKTWQDNINKRELDRRDFQTDRQFEVYKNFQKVHDRILTKMNEMRQQAGFKPIERIPSYFHSMWEGDYRVFGYDATGHKKWAMGAKTEFAAERLRAKLAEKHPELKWTSDAVQRDKYGLKDLSAFEEALKVMSKDDPVTKAIQTTYANILEHRGFGRTGLHRKGVKGSLGEAGEFEKNTLDSVLGFMGIDTFHNLRNVEKAFDQYVNQAHRYIGNLEKQKVLEDLAKIPLEHRKKMPQTIDFLYSYVHKTRGARPGEAAFEDGLINSLGKAVGLGESFPRRMVHGFSQIATVYWLTTPRFLVAQTVQSMNGIAKLIQEHGTVDGTKLFFEGWKNTIVPDAIAKEGTKWATDRGYLDPTIKNLLDKEYSDVPVGNALETIKEVMSYPAAWLEHHMVRLPVFNMFEKGLREFVPDKEKRFEIAAEKTDYYMVNYGRVHAPMIYDKLGLVGEAARPLKQYSHNYVGQFLEYASRAKQKGEYAPLAAFFATQVSVAGLKGVLFVSEATIAVNLINYIFQSNIPTPEQLLMKSNLHDALVFGGLSTVLNTDISSSVAAPGLHSMLNFPPIEFTITMMKDVGNFALNYVRGEETDNDRLKALLALTPTVAHEGLKNIYTPQGQPTANPFDPQNRGNYRRTDTERVWTSLIGAKVLDESKADMLVKNVKKELARDLEYKLSAIDAIADRVINGKPVDPSLFQTYVKNGGDPSRLTEILMQRIKERQMTGVERNQQGNITPQQGHKLQLMQQYLDHNNMPVYGPQGQPLGLNPQTGQVQEIK